MAHITGDQAAAAVQTNIDATDARLVAVEAEINELRTRIQQLQQHREPYDLLFKSFRPAIQGRTKREDVGPLERLQR